MKKIIIFILIFICSIKVVEALPKTYTRNEDSLLVPSDVYVDDNNINDIMNTYAVDSDLKIYDFADIFTEKEEKEIHKSLINYTKSTGIDAVIITVDELKDISLNQYAYNFYDYNDFLDSGVIFAISINEDKDKIFMGNKGPGDSLVFSLYTNSRINEILKYIYDNYIKSKDYNNACISFVNFIEDFYNKEYGYNDNSFRWVFIFIIAISLTLVFLLLLIMHFGKNKDIISNIINHSLKKDQMIVKCVYDKLQE